MAWITRSKGPWQIVAEGLCALISYELSNLFITELSFNKNPVNHSTDLKEPTKKLRNGKQIINFYQKFIQVNYIQQVVLKKV